MQNRQIGVYDAKTRLSEIINDVVKSGEGCTITVHGKPAVDIIPSKSNSKLTRKKVLESLLLHGGVGVNVDKAEIRSAIDEGRM